MRARSLKIIDLAVHHVATIAAGTPLLNAAKEMRSQHVGSLVVVDKDYHPLGMLTDRDITLEVVALEKDVQALSVDDVMSSPVCTANSNDKDVRCRFCVIYFNLQQGYFLLHS